MQKYINSPPNKINRKPNIDKKGKKGKKRGKKKKVTQQAIGHGGNYFVAGGMSFSSCCRRIMLFKVSKDINDILRLSK
jgi:hypothetical protein